MASTSPTPATGCRSRAELVGNAIILTAAFIEILWMYSIFLRPFPYRDTLLYGFPPLLVIGVLVRRFARRRAISELMQADFRLCLVCRYSLDDLPDGTRCPECGVPFTRAVLRATWC